MAEVTRLVAVLDERGIDTMHFVPSLDLHPPLASSHKIAPHIYGNNLARKMSAITTLSCTSMTAISQRTGYQPAILRRKLHSHFACLIFPSYERLIPQYEEGLVMVLEG
jgi:hypothetical protein